MDQTNAKTSNCDGKQQIFLRGEGGEVYGPHLHRQSQRQQAQSLIFYYCRGHLNLYSINHITCPHHPYLNQTPYHHHITTLPLFYPLFSRHQLPPILPPYPTFMPTDESTHRF